jgi:hypothetical protein
MTITTNIQALIDDANNVLDDLEGVIGQLQEIYPPTWCTEFDFTTSPPPSGWTANEGEIDLGIGWIGEAYGTGGGISSLSKTFTESDIRSIEIIHSASGYSSASQKLIRLQKDTDPYVDHSKGALDNGTDVVTLWETNVPNAVTNVKFFWDGAGSSDVTIKQITIRGVGTNPFGASTCT